jgi:hypothetical protein
MKLTLRLAIFLIGGVILVHSINGYFRIKREAEIRPLVKNIFELFFSLSGKRQVILELTGEESFSCLR